MTIKAIAKNRSLLTGDAAKKVVNYAALDALTPVSDCGKIMELARSGKANDALEFGTYIGGTAKMLASYFNHVVTIDDYSGNDVGLEAVKDILTQAQSKLSSELNEKKVELLAFDSLNDKEKLRATLKAKKLKYDFVFIDGCHDYECVKADIETSLLVVEEVAIICGHDYHMEPVKQAATEAFGKHLQVMEAAPTSPTNSIWWVLLDNRSDVEKALGRKPTKREMNILAGKNSPKTLTEALRKKVGVAHSAKSFPVNMEQFKPKSKGCGCQGKA